MGIKPAFSIPIGSALSILSAIASFNLSLPYSTALLCARICLIFTLPKADFTGAAGTGVVAVFCGTGLGTDTGLGDETGRLISACSGVCITEGFKFTGLLTRCPEETFITGSFSVSLFGTAGLVA